MDHVAVGQDEAVGSEDEPRAAAMRLAFTAATSHPLSDFDVHYRRAYALGRAYHRARVGIEQRPGIVGGQADGTDGVTISAVSRCSVLKEFQVHAVEMP